MIYCVSVPLPKTTKYQGSFRINGARAFNSLPKSISHSNKFSDCKLNTTSRAKLRFHSVFQSVKLFYYLSVVSIK